MNTIKIFRSGQEIDCVHLGSSPVLIGRDVRSRIHLPSSDISSRHGKISPSEAGYSYQDLDSTNGSVINGSPCSKAELSEGDVIRLGDFELLFTSQNSHYFGSERTMAVGLDSAALAAELATPLPASKKNLAAQLLPSITWLKGYSRTDGKPDLLAGLTIAALLVPQGMAYALLAGLPPIHGLYASVLPLILYALFGTSKHLSVGPVALDSLLVATGVQIIVQTGTTDYIQTVIVLTLMIGAIQWLMGILRLGFIVNFLSKPVLTGFTMAAAIIIAVSQLNSLLGLGLSRSSTFFETSVNTFTSLHQAHYWTAAIGISGIIALKALKPLGLPLPGPIVLLIFGTLASWLLGFGDQGVAIVGTVPSGLPEFHLLLPSQEQTLSLLPLAFTLACIGFMSALSVGKNYGSRFGYRIDANTELRGLGLANMGSSISGGFPVSGGLSRTAVNVNAGARTQLSALIAAAMVLLSIAFLTPLFYHVPIPILSAIIVSSVAGLINVAEFKYLLAVKPLEIIVLLVTLLGTLWLGFSAGLLTGLLTALIVHIVIQTKPNITLLGQLPDTSIFRSIEKHPEAKPIPGITILRIDASFYFANAEFLQKTIAELIETSPPKVIVLDASAVNDLDSSGDSAFRDIYRKLNRNNIQLYISGIKAPARDVLKRSGLYDEIGGQYFFYSVEAAVQRIEDNTSDQAIVTQPRQPKPD